MPDKYTTDVDVASLPWVLLKERLQFPKAAGIYFVLTPDGSVLYIGQSRDIRHRWGSHHKMHSLLEIEGLRLAWLSRPLMSDLITLERGFIQKMNPPMNSKFDHPRKTTKIKSADRRYSHNVCK